MKPENFLPFRGRVYEVEFAEEAAVILVEIGTANRILAQAVLRRAELLRVFPPDARFWSAPLISFEAAWPHHAMVEADNMAVEMTAHYRLDGKCVVVHLKRV
jgi:hypothetical protein